MSPVSAGYYALGEYPAAKMFLQQLVAQEPDNGQALALMGSIAEKQKKGRLPVEPQCSARCIMGLACFRYLLRGRHRGSRCARCCGKRYGSPAVAAVVSGEYIALGGGYRHVNFKFQEQSIAC